MARFSLRADVYGPQYTTNDFQLRLGGGVQQVTEPEPDPPDSIPLQASTSAITEVFPGGQVIPVYLHDADGVLSGVSQTNSTATACARGSIAVAG